MSIRRFTAMAALSAALLFNTAAFADDAESAKAAEPVAGATTTAATDAATPAVQSDSGIARGIPEKLQIHGYLTQAYARADEHQVYGIPTSGTATYGTAALQFRYAMTHDDTVVLQLSHERSGDSLVQDDGVELDWGFYERHFGANTAVKIGRVQIPFGIYNELRDVGTVLPLYRVPAAFYGEGAFENESLDGVVATHRFAAESPWSLDTAAYYGSWDTTQQSGSMIADGKLENAIGGQLWLSTPVEGLRFGAGGYHAEARDGFVPEGQKIPQTVLEASIDGNFERFFARTEARRTAAKGGIRDTVEYAQLGYRVHPKVMLVLQAEQERVRVPAAFVLAPRIDQTVSRDAVGAIDYFFRPDVVLKLEAHRNRSVGIEDEEASFDTPLPRANYAIVSLSVSF